MTQTFFFYDLETSGLNPRQDRIMQFAGRRTDLDLNPIGEPINELIRLSDDVLPSPEALLVTGITPQQTLTDGYSEAEFAARLASEVFTPETITVGFNNIRFDDEFIRHLFWRNFFDPYEWSWKDGRSRWDLLDVVRMTRALRPEGIEWPVNSDGTATNRLELLTKLNGISHEQAHDALSDVDATIAVARLIKSKQPQLFDYLFKLRDKNAVKKLVNLDVKKPFVYVSGRFDAAFQKTTVAFPLTAGRNGNLLVYDLRIDPAPFLELSESDLVKRLFASWEERRADGFVAVPVKELAFNKAPAVAPLGVLSQNDGWQKIGLTLEQIQNNQSKLIKQASFAERLRSVFENRPEFPLSDNPEEKLYDGFIDGRDKIRIEQVRSLKTDQLVDFQPNFDDERLPKLLLHYKARNFPKSLSEQESIDWEKWRAQQITAKIGSYFKTLAKLSQSSGDSQQYLLQEMQLWAESIMPATDDSL